jgi:hypothetical protein
MRTPLFVIVVAAMILGLVEVTAFAFARTHMHLFAPDAQALDEALDFQAYQAFLADRYDQRLGWRNPQSTTATVEDCLGTPKHYSWNEQGARLTGATGPVDVIVVGDSFTHGHEASDSESYPYRVQQITGLIVANHGVNAFDPLQSTLQLERVAPRYPEARLAVMGIMYENIRRVPNRYRGIYSPLTKEPFSFKPFIDVSRSDDAFRDNLNAPPAQSPEALRARIEAAIEQDYWGRPQASFPFVVSVAKVLGTRPVRSMVERRIWGAAGMIEYQDPALVGGLRRIIERFMSSARRQNLRPVIAFIPENGRDLTSPDRLIDTLRADHPDGLLLNVGQAAIDWDRYNLNGTVCHPSAYGYDQIARHIASAIALVPDRTMPPIADRR